MNGIDIKLDIKFDDLKLRDIVRACSQGANKHIRFGWLDKKRYPNSSRHKNLYVATVAYFQEYGTRQDGKIHIAPRPYLRLTKNKVKNSYNNEIREYFKSICSGNVDITILNKITVEIKKDYDGSVISQKYKSLAEQTIKLKGHGFQMDETGLLLTSFKARVYKQSFENIKL